MICIALGLLRKSWFSFCPAYAALHTGVDASFLDLVYFSSIFISRDVKIGGDLVFTKYSPIPLNSHPQMMKE
jgi:hypothetical protein